MASEIEAEPRHDDLNVNGWQMTKHCTSYRVVCWSADWPGQRKQVTSRYSVNIVRLDIGQHEEIAHVNHYHTSVYVTDTQVLVPREYTNKRKRISGFDDYSIRATLYVNALTGDLLNKAYILVFLLVYAETRVQLAESRVDISNINEHWYPQHQEYIKSLERILNSIPETVREIASKIYDDTSTLRPGSRYT